MKILAWNIRHGGRKRVDGILDALQQHDADLIVLTEFRNNEMGEKIRDHLRGFGWHHQCVGDALPNNNSVAITSKFPLKNCGPFSTALEQPHRLLRAEVNGVTMIGVYMPLGNEKTPYWAEIIAKAPEYVEWPTLMIGDFNTGKHYVDEPGATFTSANYMDLIQEAGFIDLWRDRNPEGREFTWYSNAGNGFRLDHAFATATLTPRIEDVYYSHREREEGVSDHSIMFVTIGSGETDKCE